MKKEEDWMRDFWNNSGNLEPKLIRANDNN